MGFRVVPRNSSRPRSLIYTLMLVSAGVLLAAVIAVATSEDTPNAPSLSAEPEFVSDGMEVYYFEDVATMAVTADLVVYGRVTAIEPGRKVLTGHEDSFQYRAVEIAVDEVLRGAAGDSRSRLVLEEEGYKLNGDGYLREGLEWSEVGDEGFYFLLDPSESAGYHLVNSQGRVLVNDGQLAASGSTPLEAFQRMGPDDLATMVRQAETDLKASPQ